MASFLSYNVSFNENISMIYPQAVFNVGVSVFVLNTINKKINNKNKV